ncbi:MAG TPA: serine/threonine-protein kinase [Polyangiaceae bacterium]|jgi:serine/threonine-protein kinase|nr:MAG: Serine/threonine-protein kinase PknB [Deltaproteobacteria bacterium ADurb.Bin207]HNS97084.1 serine/threonine-protein kinase [Polyangiaceae bacterium]HNZ20872.1 serine/threonine-protein kinase [Polyangiaceae bacterium]HOD21445.1 serine/threonine-protein kinase [Polyangiaceae bacterium]HOE47553.1 serine/threonine-protein kinase [Polyangiaceae bacterium]
MAEDVFGIVGTLVGGAFNVEAVVAEGGFAVVYRAYHAAFHAHVALKCLKVPVVRRVDRREFLERFREEGEVMFRLSQSIPAVVRPLHVDAFETASGVFVPYMALEWLDGETLDVMIARRRADGLNPMSPKRVVRLLAPVARALQRAHRFPGKDGPVSIVHRDLKPDNIAIATVNNEEVIKILDFGIAKVKSVASQVAGRQSQEAPAAVPFTPGYATPEQWIPKRYGQTGPWTDVWGLALCAVEAMSGKPAIDGDHAAMMGTALDERRRPTPGSEGVRVSDEVEAVFEKALAVDPRDRYHDVGRFWDDLEQALGLSSTRMLAGGLSSVLDPRSEGPPPMREERIEAADHRLRKRISVSMDKSEEKRSPMSVPDLDPTPLSPGQPNTNLEVDLSQEAKLAEIAPVPMPATSTAEQESVMDLAAPESSSSEGRAPASGALTDVQRIAEESSDHHGMAEVRGEPSGIDLAVSPGEVRRVSSSGMRAVNPEQSKLALAVSPQDVRRTSNVAMRAVRPAPPVPSANLGTRSDGYRPVSTLDSSKSKRLGIPIVLAVVGILVALAYYVNASMGGGRWALGPVPVNWIAGLLTVAGTGMILVRLFWPEE